MPKKRVSNSVFVRLFLMIFFVIIPINIILMIYAGFTFNSVRNQAIQERKNVMNLYVSTLNTSIEQITTAFKRQTSSYEMLLLMQSDEKHTRNDFEWYGAANKIMNTYGQWLADYPVFDGFFSYYDYDGQGENRYTIRSKYPQSVSDIHAQIISIVENDLREAKEKEEKYHGREWEYLRIEDEDFVIRIWKNANCYYGGWINLNNLLKSWNAQPDTSSGFVFCDTDGKICSKLPEGTDLSYEEANEKKHRFVTVAEEDTGLKLVALSDGGFFSNTLPGIAIVLLVFTLLALAAIPLIVCVTRRYVLKPVNQLLDAMDYVRRGNLQYQIPKTDAAGEFAILHESFNTMTQQLRDTKIAAYESEVERQRIQMRYLSQQIQPHFVLNTLNLLYSYEPEEYSLIQKMILCLSKYFRYIVKVHSDFVELSQELEHIRNYFEIQIARYPDRFDYYVESEEGMDEFLIPPLLIQNFTENSIKYAISMEKKVSIYVLVQFYEENKMRIRIADTGKGLPSQVLEDIQKFRETHQYQENLGIGIQNAIERLEIMYNGVPKIMFYNSGSNGATVDIIMPCKKRTEGNRDEDSINR